MTLDPQLRDALVCPLTKGPLIYDAAAQEMISNAAGLAFPIRDGIPIMLPSQARSLSEAGPDRAAAGPISRPAAGP